MSERQPPLRKPPNRTISQRTTLFLYVRAGGRCEFDGCSKYLLEHHLTETPGNFGERAHIYAFNEGGARGCDTGRPPDEEINGIENLILLCPDCHQLIDTVAPETYSVDTLKKFKRDHEERVYALTSISKNRDTVPLVLKGLVAGRATDISDDEMQSAAAPNCVKRRERVEIDLTSIPDMPDEAFWRTAATAIDSNVARIHQMRADAGKSLRLSVFALAPIPLLVHLGARLSDKVDVDLYQRHRDPETWSWKDGPGDAIYTTRRLRAGGAEGPVALLINLSGRNGADVVRTANIGDDPTIYELTLEDQEPTPLFLNTRGDLERFTAEYLRALATIREAHPHATCVHLFPAVPAPIAITLGRSRLPKVDAPLVVYDRDHRAGGYVRTMEIS